MKIDGIRDQVKVWIEDGTDYLQILGGYGRVEKALKLGIEVPCKVFRVAEVDALRIHLQDNTQREDLSFVEEVDAAKQIYTHIGGDFEEGVRALLIDKDKQPNWQFATISDVSVDAVEQYFTLFERLNLSHPLSNLVAEFGENTSE